MAKGYWIARVEVTDPEQYKAYVAANAKPLARHGGRFLVRAGKFENPEGASRDASLQFVRKLSGFNVPSKANEAAFDKAVADIAGCARELIASLVTSAEPKHREVEAAKAKARSIARFGA